MFADEAKDSDDECLRAWGDFVVLQFEREKIGSPRYKVETGSIHHRGGPDYYQFDVGSGAKIAVGDRVDVSTYKPGTWKKNAPRGEFRDAKHGLKVTRIEPQDFGGLLTVTAKEDADSIPWPKERVDELDAQIKAKFSANWVKWTDCLVWKDVACYYPESSHGTPELMLGPDWSVRFVLGFPSDVTARNFDAWIEATETPTVSLPISAVTMRAWPNPHVRSIGRDKELYLFPNHTELKPGKMSYREWGLPVPDDVPRLTALLMRKICEANWPKIVRWEFRPR